MPRIQNDDGSKKPIETQPDVTVDEAPVEISNQRQRQQRVDSKERKTTSLGRGGRSESSGWLAAWLEEAEGHGEKDEIKALKEAAKR